MAKDKNSSPQHGSTDWTVSMPVGHHHPFTPEGEIEQYGKLASGLERGMDRRRIVAYLLPALYVCAGVAVLLTVLAVLIKL